MICRPKYRRQGLVDVVTERLKQIIQATTPELKAVHLLCDFVSQFSIHRLARQLEGRSCRWLRQEFSYLRSCWSTLWINSYVVSPVGGAPWAVIKGYIENPRNV